MGGEAAKSLVFTRAAARSLNRLRVGNWRAIFTIEPDRIIVHAVGPRSTIYD